MFRNEMMGLDRSYFNILEEHFVVALDDCFITGLDYELCKAYFAELLPVFKECTKVSKYREDIVERMGGEATFDLVVVSYCERIEGDIKLHRFFQGYDLHTMTHLQKELILMAFLQPSAENNVEVLERRVTSSFSRMFAMGLNEYHFERMEKHFSAALFDCLSRPQVIQTCCKLFSNLISFFEENIQSSADNDDDDDDEEEDNQEEMIIYGRRYSTGSRLSYNEGMSSHIAKKISAALDASDRTESTTNGSSRASRSVKSSEFDYGSGELAAPVSPKPSKRRASSMGFRSPLLGTPKMKMGRPKLAFSWKSPTLKKMKKSVVINSLPDL